MKIASSIVSTRNSARKTARAAGSASRTAACTVEPLEDRTLMSTYSVTNLLDHGTGSLRQAIQNANNHAGADVIAFANNVAGTVVLTTGQLNVTDSVQVQGPGAAKVTVSGNNQTRILQVSNPSANVTLSGLTFTKGNPGIHSGGAIQNVGKLTLAKDVFANNVAASFDEGKLPNGNPLAVGGGAVQNSGTLNVADTTFDNNHVYTHDGDGFNGGGAIYNSGTLSVTRTTFSNNTGQRAPGLQIIGDPDGYVAYGGGVFNSGTALFTNATFYGNTVDGMGGALYDAGNGASTLVNDTVVNNYALYEGGGVGGSTFSKVKIGNTIVAGNNDADAIFGGADVSAPFQSLTHNLIGQSYATWAPNDIVGTPQLPEDPKLGPLANNGGPTKTLANTPFAGASYNGGSNQLAALYGLNTDQRGFARVANGTIDIGAYEGPFPGKGF